MLEVYQIIIRGDILSLLFAFLDALLNPLSNNKSVRDSKRYRYDDVSWEEECQGCGEYFEDCCCEYCDDEDCEDW